jgi:hypothetical protein
LDSSVEGLELVAGEWPSVARIVERDDDAVFLYVRDAKPVVREWGDEFDTVRQVVKFVQERVPTDAERHTEP